MALGRFGGIHRAILASDAATVDGLRVKVQQPQLHNAALYHHIIALFGTLWKREHLFSLKKTRLKNPDCRAVLLEKSAH